MKRSGASPLVWLALIGVLLYAGIAFIGWLSGQKLDEGRPAVDRAQAEAVAIAFLKERTPLSGQAQMDAVYQTNKPVSAYVAKQHLDKMYKQAFASRVPLDYWEVHILDGSGRYVVQVGIDKPVIGGWSTEHAGEAHPDLQSPALGPPDQGPAPTQAEKLAAEKAILAAGYSLNDFGFTGTVASSSDLLFTSHATVLGEAKQVLLVDVQGGKVTGLQPDFQLPASFHRWFDRQNAMASWFSYGSLVAMSVFGLAALILAIRFARSVTFVRGILLTLIFAGIYIGNVFNAMPAELAAAGKGATDSPLASTAYAAVMTAFILVMAIAVYLSLVSGDALWRRRGWNPWPRWREQDYGRQVWTGMWRGYLICLFALGLQQLLFAAADQAFHSFSINDPSQSLLNMKTPALFPTMAWMAGISEEILFRLFAIVVLRKLLKNTFAAVLGSAFLWALGHAAYAIYPSYTRLFEVTVLGIVFGYTFLRYGLITAIFAHASMDSLLMGLTLIFEGRAGEAGAGGLYIASPALVAGIIWIAHRLLKGKPPGTVPIGPSGA